jgi:peptidoglycan biosynthesis protein MviN/MurJ (putative lipid II flippase)
LIIIFASGETDKKEAPLEVSLCCIHIPTGCFSSVQLLHKLLEIIEKFAAVGHSPTSQSLILVRIKNLEGSYGK